MPISDLRHVVLVALQNLDIPDDVEVSIKRDHHFGVAGINVRFIASRGERPLAQALHFSPMDGAHVVMVRLKDALENLSRGVEQPDANPIDD